jgi:hypothetical protein
VAARCSRGAPHDHTHRLTTRGGAAALTAACCSCPGW